MIFVETFEPAAESRFDVELDEAVRGWAVRRRVFTGHCNVADTLTSFEIRSDNLREDIVAVASGSINRQRQLVATLSVAVTGAPDAGLPGLCRRMNDEGKAIYMAESLGVLATAFQERAAALTCSEYLGPDLASGQVVDGIRHEDLERTSFADESFDVVITNDVLEHVPDALQAEREIVRILRPGGVYCFTVPFLPHEDRDRVLAERASDGSVVHHEEPQYHSDPVRPDEGVLVYRLFSYGDLRRRFEALGCRFTVYRLWSKRLGILGPGCLVMVARKADEDASS